MDIGEGEAWIRGLDLDPQDETVDEAAWMAAEVSVSIQPSLSLIILFSSLPLTHAAWAHSLTRIFSKMRGASEFR